ncbi:HD-GYP domain-containing protein [Streptomyces sp. NPDC048718]|uniref:HD-GYP domain-containing protein n=1 Tax=Streptomyces sp. NPDC048718 TaxID=3365587 RepID=UPI0037236427
MRPHPGRPGRLTIGAVHTGALLLTLGGLGSALRGGLDDPVTALAFAALIGLGELTRRAGIATATLPGLGEPRERDPAPTTAAASLAYALLGGNAGHPTHHGVLQTVAIVAPAALLGALPHVLRGRGPELDHLARGILSVGFAALCFQPFSAGSPLAARLGQGPSYALLLLFLLLLTALCDAVLAALLRRARSAPRRAPRAAGATPVPAAPFAPLLRDELRGLVGIGSAVCATGAVMALGVAVVGLWALPVFAVPLLLAQVSFRRFAAVRTTNRETIASLARATEVAGCTRPGHAHRVAALSRAVGRELGLAGAELTVLAYAALMHDIGQLSLVDPVAGGATAPLPPAEQRRIALLGGAVVRQTGVPPQVAVVVERQADPYREQPLAARIVRVVNAYDELAADGADGAGGGPTALERLRLGTARDYHPDVVEALARVLARGGPATAAEAGTTGSTGTTGSAGASEVGTGAAAGAAGAGSGGTDGVAETAGTPAATA